MHKRMMVTKQKGALWYDHKGHEVEVKRVFPFEKLRDSIITSITKTAIKTEAALLKLKDEIDEKIEKLISAFLKENGIKVKDKPNSFTFYNFNQTAKVVHEVKEETVYDANLMVVAYDKIKAFISKYSNSIDKIIVDMLLDALKSTKGRYDNRKIGTILSYQDHKSLKNNKMFQEGIAAIKKAKEPGSFKTYTRIYIKTTDDHWDILNTALSYVQNMDTILETVEELKLEVEKNLEKDAEESSFPLQQTEIP